MAMGARDSVASSPTTEEVAMPGPRKVSALLAISLLAACGAAPAHATVIDRGTFSGSESGVPEEICGIALVRDSTFSGSFRIRVDKQSGGQAFFQRMNFTFRDVFTNPANHRSMTFAGHSVTNEIKATQVAGNVYEFTVVEAGQPFTVRDGAGNVVLRDRGVLRHRELFDTLGDGMPGGITLEDEIVAVGGPHPGFDQTEEEFCAMVTALVG
jgi:hypothetical protein